MAWRPDYVTTVEARNYGRIGDDADDAQIARAVSAASRAVDRYTGRQFGVVAAPEARVYTARWSKRKGAWSLLVDDFMTTAGLALAWDGAADGTFSTVVAPTGAVTWPPNAVVIGKPWERLFLRSGLGSFDSRAAGFRVTATWGWTSVPVPIQQAVLLQVSRLHARRDAPFGVAGSPSEGSEIRLLAKLDPDVMTTVEPFRRRAWVR